MGSGPYSSNVTVLTPTVPIRMNAPNLRSLSCSSIVIDWLEFSTLTDQGRIPIVNYNLFFAVNTSSIWNKLSPALNTSYTILVSNLT
jgi:hypothetical protein